MGGDLESKKSYRKTQMGSTYFARKTSSKKKLKEANWVSQKVQNVVEAD